jgi:hypothetical protein
MAQLPTRFLGLVTRTVLVEMIVQTYAEAKNIDPNEAYTRLDTALKSDVKLIGGLQQAIWSGLRAKKPALADVDLVEHVAKRLEKPKRFKALKPKRAESGALAAVTIAMDAGAGFAGGEARDLLYSPEGEKLYAAGIKLLGDHVAAEMLR